MQPIQCMFFVVVVCLFLIFYLFIYWLLWVFVAAHGLSLVAASGGYSSLQCAGFSLWWLLLLQSTGMQASVVAAHVLSSCGSRAQLLRGMWDPPRLGLEPRSPALAGQASVAVAHGLSCSVACGIFPDQGSNLCPLHWQADS